ncbi:hypothetical protein [Citrobacter freundii]|uniref:hypothetical protein n=1 Tax=Citrobacter freundii TaxID=546 RepID=UPI003D7192A7
MKPDVKKIIADIKATKGNRKFCNGLAGTLQDDNYASSICKYVKTVTPERIDLLIEYTENLEAEVTDMAVQLANTESKCRELAAENEKRNTHSEALAVDNAALREVVERMVNQFAMSGISPEEKSINPAKSLMFDAKSALFMPATDAYLAEVRASSIPDEATERDLFEEWVMEKIFISKTTLEGLRTDDGYRNSTLSGTDYNGMWSQWKAIRAAQLRQEASQ